MAESAGKTIDRIIDELGDWRGELLARVRELITQAEPDVVEELKWQTATNPLGVPFWSHEGIICTGETYKDKVKLTFAKGASLEDPDGLFNASLDAKVRRVIDLHDDLDPKAVRAAAGANASQGHRGANAFTADVVAVDGRPSAKVGRELRPNSRLEPVG